MISVKNLKIQQGDFVLENISFELPAQQYGVLMGRSGCGKTTVLEAICGLRPIREGSVKLANRDVTRLKASNRNIGYVPQDIALFQTMKVKDQIGFALIIRKWSKTEIKKRIHELAELLGIEYLLERKPQGLSGGEAQRVALGRALAASPHILCLDEPMGAIDDDTREDMFKLLERIREQTKVTTLHITHSSLEAERLADKIFIFQNGKIRCEESKT